MVTDAQREARDLPQAEEPPSQSKPKDKSRDRATAISRVEESSATPKTGSRSKPSPLPQAEESVALKSQAKGKATSTSLPQAESSSAAVKAKAKSISKAAVLPPAAELRGRKKGDSTSTERSRDPIPSAEAGLAPGKVPKSKEVTSNKQVGSGGSMKTQSPSELNQLKAQNQAHRHPQTLSSSSKPRSSHEQKHGSLPAQRETIVETPSRLESRTDTDQRGEDDEEDAKRSGDDLEYDPEHDAGYWGSPAAPGSRTVTTDDFVDNDDDEELVLEQVIKTSAKSYRLKEYRWAKSTIDFVQIPATFQDANPMSSAERREIIKETPSNFSRVFPCKGTTSLGEDKKYIETPSEIWWLEKGIPKLHQMMTEELRALLFFVQECGDEPEKIGLQLDEMTSLLKGIITLHVDTMKMISAMQRQRAWRAMGSMDPDKPQEDPEQQIISDKQKEVEKRKVEQKLAFEMGKGHSFLQRVSSFKKRKTAPFSRPSYRRPRFARRGAAQHRAREFYEETPQTSFLQRTRGRGRGFRGRISSTRGRGSRGRGSRGRGINQPMHS